MQKAWANFKGNGTIYRHNKKLKRAKTPEITWINQARSEALSRASEWASKCLRHKKRVNLSTLQEIKSHDVILARTVLSQRSSQVSRGCSKARNTKPSLDLEISAKDSVFLLRFYSWRMEDEGTPTKTYLCYTSVGQYLEDICLQCRKEVFNSQYRTTLFTCETEKNKVWRNL